MCQNVISCCKRLSPKNHTTYTTSNECVDYEMEHGNSIMHIGTHILDVENARVKADICHTSKLFGRALCMYHLRVNFHTKTVIAHIFVGICVNIVETELIRSI